MGEYGWDGTAGTIFWIDPKEQTVIVLMTQSVPANPDSLRQRLKALVRAAIRTRPQAAPARIGALSGFEPEMEVLQSHPPRNPPRRDV